MAEKNDGRTSSFESDTREALRRCARWLYDNSEDLAHVFAGGCRQWSVEFAAGVQGIFPETRISVNKIQRDVIEAYGSKESRSAMDEERWWQA